LQHHWYTFYTIRTIQGDETPVTHAYWLCLQNCQDDVDTGTILGLEIKVFAFTFFLLFLAFYFFSLFLFFSSGFFSFFSLPLLHFALFILHFFLSKTLKYLVDSSE